MAKDTPLLGGVKLSFFFGNMNEIMSTAEAKKKIAARRLGLMALGFTASMAATASAFADAATDLVGQAGSGGINSAQSLMNGSAGTLIYLVIGLSVLAMVVGIILWIVHKAQGKKG